MSVASVVDVTLYLFSDLWLVAILWLKKKEVILNLQDKIAWKKT